MINNTLFSNMLERPVRALRGRVEVYEGSTLLSICGCHDSLKEFTVERLGENKFFGYGVCNKLNVKLIDKERKLNISTANNLEVEFGIDTNYLYPFPSFYVSEVRRDEVTNELSITAYDALYKASAHTVAELELFNNYTIREFVLACGALLGLPVVFNSYPEFDREYIEGANFDGTETIREALNAVAEATQTIYFINWDWQLTFKRLSNSEEAALTIDKELYFNLDSSENRRLAKVVHATELGDNVAASIAASGTTQYVRNNPFWDLRNDIGEIVESAVSAVGGLTLNQFTCEWRGNPLLEIGDKINIVTKDNNIVSSYLLNDRLSFDGSLKQNSSWHYEDNQEETAENATTLGDALRQTFARVDKANREIALVASELTNTKDTVSSLVLNTEGIAASVETIEKNTEAALEGLNSEVSTLTNRVNATITSEDVQLQIETELANGVDKVTTATGFTFNETGLIVSKTGSEMTTTITEDGMTVYRDAEAVLVADNEGVKAEDLNATTYLIIGANSRFENYGANRTGCFWIGGN